MKIGFIGTGNMGSSIIKGILSSKSEKSENINIFDLDKEKVNNLVKEYGVNAVNSEKELAENCNIIILSVKPHIIPIVLKNLSGNVKKDTIILTIAAGISISVIENALGEDKKVVRTMPNTPAQVLSGMTAITFNKNIENKRNIFFR